MKIRIYSLLSFLLVNLFPVFSQNLIRNGSFEEYTDLPISYGEFSKVKYWNTLSEESSVEYWNKLSPYQNWQFPYDAINDGVITPYDSNAICGFFLWNIRTLFREYISTQLNEKLCVGCEYNLSFGVKSLDNVSPSTLFYANIDAIQVLFTTTPLIQNYRGDAIFSNQAFNLSDTIVDTKKKWSDVSFRFTAQEEALYMTVGNFRKNDAIRYDTIVKSANNSNATILSYYYFDDFKLEKIEKPLTGDTLYRICKGDSVLLKISGDSINKWYTNEGELISENVLSMKQRPDKTTRYQVKGSTHSLKIKVEVFDPKPVFNDTVVCLGNEWLPAQNSFYYDSIWVHHTKPIVPLDYSGQLPVVYWQNGCKSMDTISYRIQDCEIAIDFPNIFTPNGDTKNDVFIPIIYKGISSAFLTIYNRWGGLVYETNDPLSGWIGLDVTDGIYYWHCHYTDRNGKTGELKSWVQIVR